MIKFVSISFLLLFACNKFIYPEGGNPLNIIGCTNEMACNYLSDATEDSGLCEYTSCVGCTEPNACNYNDGCEDSPTGACTQEDGSCEYSDSFTGYYYEGNPSFSSLILERQDEFINFSWGGGSPDPLISNDDFQVRWIGYVYAYTSGVYNFYSRTDDGARLYINDEEIIDAWFDSGDNQAYADIYLNQGPNKIVYEFYENGGGAFVELKWTPPGQSEEFVFSSCSD